MCLGPSSDVDDGVGVVVSAGDELILVVLLVLIAVPGRDTEHLITVPA